MAQDLIVNGVTYPAVAQMEMTNTAGEKVIYSEGTGGGTPVEEEKDVNFYDYDGTLLYSYTLAEAQALTELPPLPSRDGLICQGWNWDLESVNAVYYGVDIGASYITDDGKTRIYITIDQDVRLNVDLNINQSVSGGVTVNWGDGSAAETINGTGYVSITHNYAGMGDYIITLEVTAGKMYFGTGVDETGVLGPLTAQIAMAKEMHIGSNVSKIGNYGVAYCYRLEKITIPEGISEINTGAIRNNRSLSAIVFPKGVTGVSNYAAAACHSAKRIIYPSTLNSAGTQSANQAYALKRMTPPINMKLMNGYAIANQYGLSSVDIPIGITDLTSSLLREDYALSVVKCWGNIKSIAAQVFYNCTSLKVVDLTACTSVPTLANVNAFTGVPADCEIRVPAALYDEWIAATNWSTYAANIVGV